MPDNPMQEIPPLSSLGSPSPQENPPTADLDKVLEKELLQVPSADGKSGGIFSAKTIIIIVVSVLVLGGIGASAYYFMTKSSVTLDTENSTPPTISNPFATKDETATTDDSAITDDTAPTDDSAITDDTAPTDDSAITDDTAPTDDSAITDDAVTVTPDDTTATPDAPPSLAIPENPPADSSDTTPADTTADAKTDLQNQVEELKTATDAAADVTADPTISDQPTTPKKVPRK